MSSTEMQAFPSTWIKRWENLSKLAAWVAGIIGGFWLPPPIPTEESEAFVNAARFIITILIASSIYFALKYQKHYHSKGWLIAAILSFSIFISGWFLYDYLKGKWVCNVTGQLLVVGEHEQLTARGKDQVKKPECNSCENLIFECGNGKPERIWMKESIESNRRKLIAIYFSILPFLVLCITSTLQALYCQNQPDLRLNFHALWEGLLSDSNKVQLDLYLPVDRKQVSGHLNQVHVSEEQIIQKRVQSQPIQDSHFHRDTLYFKVLDRNDTVKYRMALSSTMNIAILDRQDESGGYHSFCTLSKSERSAI